MKVNGVPFPPEMSLQDFFNKAKQGYTGAISGTLANPLFNQNTPDALEARLEFFNDMLTPNVMNPEDVTYNTPSSDVIGMLNLATHGDNFADDLSNSVFNDTISPTNMAAEQAYNDYGLPLWFAKMKGLV